MLLFAEILFLLAAAGLLLFLLLLGERNRLHVQRGWYIIIAAFALLFIGSVVELLDDFKAPALQVWMNQPVVQIGVKLFAGYALGLILLLVGLFLWAPAVVASRERYLTRIKDSERRYRLLTENATDLLAEHDLDGVFRFVTPTVRSLLGYEPEELVGHSIYEFFDPADIESIRHEHQKILTAEGPVVIPYRFRHKDGHYIWLESSTRIYKAGPQADEPRILAVSRDITERIHHERDLEELNRTLTEQQHRIRLLYELSASSELSMDEQLERTLRAGVEHLGLSLGIISRIDGYDYHVLHSYAAESGPAKGQIFQLGDTYCSITLQHEDLLAIENMHDSPHSGHPCYEAFHLETYIGVPIKVNGERFGTLNFSQPEARKEPFSDADHDFVRLMGQWVSRVLEQNRATRELQKSEARFRAVVRSAIVGVITMDSQGRIQSFNRSAEKIFGYSKEEVMGQNVARLMADSESQQHDAFLANFREGKPQTNLGESREVVAQHKDGHPIYLDLGISEVRTESEHFLTGMFRDITARKKAEIDLANTTLRLQNVFNSAMQVALIATDLEGRITVFNPGAERMLGYTAAEALGRVADFFHEPEEERARARELSEKLGRTIQGFETYIVLAQMGGLTEHEWTYVRKNGSHLTVNSAVTAIHDTEGNITGYLGVALDISERKRAEEALRLAKQVAEEANQTKSEFLANMSHELRTPLNSVIGFSNILLKNADGHLHEKDLTYLERIQANGKHLLSLINDVLDLSKIEAGRMELEWVEINVGQLIQDLISQVESQVRHKQVELVTDIPADLNANSIDPGKLKQVILNLLSNAIKFTDTGTVTVQILQHDQSGQVERIRVTDTGIGIPRERLEHIFEEFSQVDASTQRKYGGTGLGLSISKSLCDLMGCAISVESVEGQGSTFTVTLPLNGSTKQSSGDQLRPERRSTDRSQLELESFDFSDKRVLIIDDDVDSRTLLTHYLSDSGCEIDVVDSARKGLAAIRRQRPDVITLDMKMPKIDGKRFVSAVQNDSELKEIPIILVSIMANDYRGKLPGVREYLQKPVARSDYLWALRRCLQTSPCCLLIVEDDTDMQLTLTHYLEDINVEIKTAGDGREALDIMEHFKPNMIFLDLMMPKMNGQQFLGELEKRDLLGGQHIIVVTAKDLTPMEELELKSNRITLVRKNANLEKELRQEILGVFEKREA